MTGKDFYNRLRAAGYEYFAGIPDSTLAPFILEIDREHCVPHNEGGAVAGACGYHLATGKTPVVYMQNAGLWNSINPLLSLAKLYDIPMLLIVGYRGQPGSNEENAAHIADGEITEPALRMLGIDYSILWEGTRIEYVKKGIFCLLAPMGELEGQTRVNRDSCALSRRDVVRCIIDNIDDDSKVVASLGYLSRELYDLRENHENDFFCVGAMGHASMVAIEIAKKTRKKVYLLDGDGSAIMHLGALAYIIDQDIENLYYIVFNNGCYDSVGGTGCLCYLFPFMPVKKISALKKALRSKRHKFIEIYTRSKKIKCGRPADLIGLKTQFMDGLKKW